LLGLAQNEARSLGPIAPRGVAAELPHSRAHGDSAPDANDPRWRDFRDLALGYGLRACWSTPIHRSDGTVVGTFANYHKVVVRDPSPVDLELTGKITHAAATAIENARRPWTCGVTVPSCYSSQACTIVLKPPYAILFTSKGIFCGCSFIISSISFMTFLFTALRCALDL
jgi:hypothetical protein